MKIIDRIRKKFIEKEYEFTIPHFFEEMAEDDLEEVIVCMIMANAMFVTHL
jgi:hypothetical protein